MPIQELDEMEKLLEETTDCFHEALKKLVEKFEVRLHNGEFA